MSPSDERGVAVGHDALIGSTLRHFRITGRLGEGGMGVVYRAHDSHLERDVAIKVMAAGLIGDENARKRFRREALALSRLKHPYIATVHDFDSEGGVDFLVMELVEGTPLSGLLAAGPLDEQEAIRLGIQVAEALDAAASKGIIHRDLKPANITRTPSGDAKVLDFGLARLAHLDTTSRTLAITEKDDTVGTVPYMSPEQLRGEVVDPRTDVYSLGVTLYELATGRLPWGQRQLGTLAHEILFAPQPLLRAARSDLSAGLEAIVQRCMERDRANRYSSARDLATDLRALQRGDPPTVAMPGRSKVRPLAVAAGLTALVAVCLLVWDPVGLRDRWRGSARVSTLAVLPLEDLTPDHQGDYFANGMTDELITRLAQLRALTVIARASVMIHKGSHESPAKIGTSLGADLLVTGSILRSGTRARISAQLVRARNGVTLWADSYESDLRDVLTVQGQVASAIASRIDARLSSPERARLARIRPVEPRAHDAYLRGRAAWDRHDESGLRSSIREFERAIQIDPTFAVAYSALADAWAGVSSLFEPASVAMPRARAAAQRALELDPQLAEAHSALGLVLAFYDWKWSEAEVELRKGIELSPSSDVAHRALQYFLYATGRTDEALSVIRRAREIDPLSLNLSSQPAAILYYGRRYDDAIAQARSELRIHPDYHIHHIVLGASLIQKGQFRAGIAELQQVARMGAEPYPLALLGAAYAKAGMRQEAVDALAALEELEKKGTYVQAYARAIVYASLGDHAHAIDCLERAFEEHSEELGMIKVDPLMDPLRSDPRFRAILERLGLGT